jgi:hypothetical protein
VIIPARIRALTANLLLIGFSTLVALLVGEVLVRWLAPQPRALSAALHNLYVLDDELGYVLQPGFDRHIRTHTFTSHVETNSLGLRDHEIGPLADHTLRVLGIGDSFTFGVHAGELDHCYLKHLERLVTQELSQGHSAGDSTASASASRSGRSLPWQRAEFINAGVDGYGTVQEVGLLERLNPEVQPQAVLVGFFLGNDFTDNSGLTRMTVIDGFHVLKGSLDPHQPSARPWYLHVRLFLHAHSDAYLLLKRRLLHPLRARLQTSGEPVAVATRHHFEYYVFDSGFADCMRPEPTPVWREAERATRDALRELRTWCDAHDLPVLLFAIPTPMQIDPQERQRWLQRFDLDAADFDFRLPNRRLARLAREAGLPLVDLTDALAAEVARGVPISFETDEHWTATGHEVAAGLLLEPVMQHLVDTSPAAQHVHHHPQG